MKQIKYFTCRRAVRFRQKQKLIFFKQLALILSSGLSLLQGLELIERRSDKEVAIVCRRLRSCLERGSSLAEAMAEQPRFFSKLAVALTVVGEESGRLSEILEELAAYYSKQEVLKAVLLKAAMYPIFLLLFSVVVLCFFIGYVLPILGNAYASLQVKPSGLLSILLEFRNSEMIGAELLLVSLAGFTMWSRYQYQGVFEAVLKLPFVWSTYKIFMELRFCKLLSLMLNSGMDITRAVGLCSEAIDCRKGQSLLLLFNQRLQRGVDIGSAAEGCSSFFSPLTIELITVGAATGYLPEMLMEAARLEEQELMNRMDRLKELLAPRLLVVAALVTGAVVCSVVEPLFGLVGQIA